MPTELAPGVMASDEPPNFHLWCGVRAKGLVHSAQHNRKIGEIIALAHPETGRFGVLLVRDGGEIRIKPCN